MVTYGYDERDRLVAIDYTDGTPAVRYGYDANDNCTFMTDDAGRVDYGSRLTAGPVLMGPNHELPMLTSDFYTQLDNATVAAVEVIPASLARTVRYGYTDGRLTSTSFPNGQVETRSYHPSGRLDAQHLGVSGSTLWTRDYAYDANGNPIRVESTTEPGFTYRYDTRDRLVEECYQPTSCTGATSYVRYGYDAVGNRTSVNRSGTTTTAAYDPADRLTSTTTGGTTSAYAHDANGNLTSGGGRSMAYDQASRTTSVTQGGATTGYTYDGDGTRLTAGGTRFSWDPNHELPMLTSERASNQALQRRFGYGLDLVSLLTPSGESWYHHDGLGSVQHLTNPGGQAEWDYDYDAYGQLIEHAQLRSDAPANPMRYTGEYADPTGLYHLRARQYDPAIGRFTQTDPAAAQLTDPYVAAYVYTHNRPTRSVDPSGAVSIVWEGRTKSTSSIAW